MKILAATALAQGESIDAAAEAAGVSRQTLWRWDREDDEFRQIRAKLQVGLGNDAVVLAVSAARRMTPAAVQGLGTKIREGDVKAMIAILKTQPEFHPTRKIEVSGVLERRLAELDASGDPGTPD